MIIIILQLVGLVSMGYCLFATGQCLEILRSIRETNDLLEADLLNKNR